MKSWLDMSSPYHPVESIDSMIIMTDNGCDIASNLWKYNSIDVMVQHWFM